MLYAPVLYAIWNCACGAALRLRATLGRNISRTCAYFCAYAAAATRSRADEQTEDSLLFNMRLNSTGTGGRADAPRTGWLSVAPRGNAWRQSIHAARRLYLQPAPLHLCRTAWLFVPLQRPLLHLWRIGRGRAACGREVSVLDTMPAWRRRQDFCMHLPASSVFCLTFSTCCAATTLHAFTYMCSRARRNDGRNGEERGKSNLNIGWLARVVDGAL